MTDTTSGIQPKVGQGFFSETGELKARDALSQQGAQKSDAPESNDQSVETTFSEKDLHSALSKVEGRFTEKASEIVSTANKNDEALAKAQEVVKEQLVAARELKKALKGGDQDKIDKARSRLERATEQRDEQVSTIKSLNQETADERVRSLNVGNEQKGIVKLNKLEFESSAKVELSRPKDVDQLISKLKDDRKAIREQRKEIKEVVQTVEVLVSGAKEQLSRVEKGTLNSFEDARKLANSLAKDIVGRGAQALTANNINADIAARLLQ